MTVNNEKVISWFNSRKGKITYSMYGSRNGSDGTADCSGSVVQAVYEAGGSEPDWLYNTDSMHGYLLKNGYKLISENQEWDAKRGDIYIFGRKGASGGSAGHTGVLVSCDPNSKEISCDYSTGGVVNTAIQEYGFDGYWANAGYPYFYIYRNLSSNNGINQSTIEGEWIAEKGFFKLNTAIFLSFNYPLSGKKILLNKGDKIKYDQYKIDYNGYVWIRQSRENGKFAYLPTGESLNGKRISIWGCFE
ncbi:peptidoglycan amidohydrolase family protein [Floricoccus penangensis]|uniref:peptidoglycan amidohydrolase family protein n=1 Tax=Floricoccus penangensis TaxID=1859475 RepID=UPI0020405A1E|nr:peptidoglycan amidohydrolase family protein [Floricoccus penangensis]URZ87056.1 hypothetical protein KIW23_08205 [Floricoccus penangensis]